MIFIEKEYHYEESKKYTTKTEFKKLNSVTYRVAVKNKWIEEMTWIKGKIKKLMSKSRIMEFAENLQTMQNQIKELLRKFKNKSFAKSKKKRIFASQSEPTALAFTDFTKPSPILSSKDAERFIKNMEEAERRAEERKHIPKSKEQLEKELNFKTWLYDFEKRKLEDLEKEIIDLEQKLNGKTEER